MPECTLGGSSQPNTSAAVAAKRLQSLALTSSKRLSSCILDCSTLTFSSCRQNNSTGRIRRNVAAK